MQQFDRMGHEIWSDEDIRLLHDLIARKLSAARIADEINKQSKHHYTRNAIIGKSHRLKTKIHGEHHSTVGEIKNRASGAKKMSIRTVRILEAKTRIASPSIVNDNANLTNQSVSFLDRVGDRCTAMLDATTCCGKPTPAGSSWCPEHRALYYMPARTGR